ncbi:MAG: homoserine dehydrogenase [Oscillospiraceae bacterium]|jgi:homoserine dehydrogenase|nr:homoserine dehydrogenase [Oscillospiraceae bacterium]
MIKIAVIGFGVVGSGVVHVLHNNTESIMQNAGQEISVKYILDIAEFPESQYSFLFIKDFETIVTDPEITVVVEAIGGVGAALDYTRRSLEAGKNVVTSNKELVAEHGSELLRLAMEKGVNYLFEASVGGGIPIVRPIIQCMTANIISEIYGILNGTTNYILTDMEKNSADFSDSLLEAQKKGYAEADPTADIEGHDTCRKICILSSLAFGRHVFPKQVPTKGITGVTIDDMRFAATLGYKIKLLGRARVVGDKLSAYVAPHLVGNHNLLATVDNVMNGVAIRGNAVGKVVFCGAGAGKLPTASAVVADVIDAVKHLHTRRWISWTDDSDNFISDCALLESAWYIRTNSSREKVEKEFGNVIFADEIGADESGTDEICTTETGVEMGAETAFITGVMSGKKIDDLLERGVTACSCFRVLGDY